MLSTKTKFVVKSGVIAGLYVVLSLVTFPVASGAIQFRISEGLTILPLIFVEAIPGLTIGCLLINIITGCTVLDVIAGSVITFLASILTYSVRKLLKNNIIKVMVGGIFPIVLNAFLLPLVWYFSYGELEYMYIIQVLFLLLSQSVAVYVVGTPLYFSALKLKEKGIIF